MPTYSTDWTTTSTESTNWVSADTGGTWQLDSTTVLLNSTTDLLSGIDSSSHIYTQSTDWDSTTTFSTSWESDDVSLGILLLEGGDSLLIENGNTLGIQ